MPNSCVPNCQILIHGSAIGTTREHADKELHRDPEAAASIGEASPPLQLRCLTRRICKVARTGDRQLWRRNPPGVSGSAGRHSLDSSRDLLFVKAARRLLGARFFANGCPRIRTANGGGIDPCFLNIDSTLGCAPVQLF